MTEAEAFSILCQAGGTVGGQRLQMIVESFQADSSQIDAARWVLNASEESIAAVWCRAVAMLKLPADVRELAQWN